MKRMAWKWMMVTMCLVCAGAAALGADPAGRVSFIEGSARGSGKEGTHELVVGAAVYEGDTIETGTGSRIEIDMIDGTKLSQGEKGKLTVSKFAFAPGERKGSDCVLDMFAGVFRVITGRITRLNPEGFKVKTRYGTIGIRGCDLGFRLLGDHDRVYVVALHHADSVLVAMRDGIELPAGKASSMEVNRGGSAVDVSPSDGLRMFRFEMRELEDLILGTTPVPRAGEAGEPGAGKRGGKPSGEGGYGPWNAEGYGREDTGDGPREGWVQRLRHRESLRAEEAGNRERGLLFRLFGGSRDRLDRIDENTALDLPRPGVVSSDATGALCVDGTDRHLDGSDAVVDPYNRIKDPVTDAPGASPGPADRRDDPKKDGDDDNDDGPPGNASGTSTDTRRNTKL